MQIKDSVAVELMLELTNALFWGGCQVETMREASS